MAKVLGLWLLEEGHTLLRDGSPVVGCICVQTLPQGFVLSSMNSKWRSLTVQLILMFLSGPSNVACVSGFHVVMAGNSQYLVEEQRQLLQQMCLTHHQPC